MGGEKPSLLKTNFCSLSGVFHLVGIKTGFNEKKKNKAKTKHKIKKTPKVEQYSYLKTTNKETKETPQEPCEVFKG